MKIVVITGGVDMTKIDLTYVVTFRSFSAHSARIIQMKSLNDKMNRVFITSSLDKTIKVTFHEIRILFLYWQE